MLRKEGHYYLLLDNMLPTVVTPEGEAWLYPRNGDQWIEWPKTERLTEAKEPAGGLSSFAFHELFGPLPELPPR